MTFLKKIFVVQSKVSIFHQIQPIHTVDELFGMLNNKVAILQPQLWLEILTALYLLQKIWLMSLRLSGTHQLFTYSGCKYFNAYLADDNFKRSK